MRREPPTEPAFADGSDIVIFIIDVALRKAENKGNQVHYYKKG